jgi:phosphohistidine phosphatase SixA
MKIRILCLVALAACSTSPASTGGMPPIATSSAPASRAANGPLVILVRHAEKADDSPTDPTLSAAGEARARALADALRDAGVTHVITTQFRRTGLTAAPLARQLGLTPEVVPTQGAGAHDSLVAAAVRRRGPREVVLVVGHSNSVPSYVAALGGPRMPQICDAQYGNLFVLSLAGTTPRLVRASFGAPDPPC